MQFKVFVGNDSLLEEAYKIRFRVFVDEQSVPAEIEKDEFDLTATHVLLLEDDKAVATGRIFADAEQPSVARLGRVAVLPELRGAGFGRSVCEKLLELAREQGFARVMLHAQLQVEGLYQRMGFKRCGNEFVEAGIMHVEMEIGLK